VGFDLSGLEAGNPPAIFEQEFMEARAEGFPVTVHCGETMNSEDIWNALVHLKPSRISHGLSCVQDKSLLEYLRYYAIPVEVCPSANWLTKTVPDLHFHPLLEMHKSGLNVTINTDNPSICSTTLSREYAIVKTLLNFSNTALADLFKNSLSSAFGSAANYVNAANFAESFFS